MKKILCLSFVLTTLMACSKNNTDTYPAVSSEGINIWASKVNGKAIIYKGTPSFGNENGVYVTTFTSSGIVGLTLSGSLTKSPTENTAQIIEISTNNLNLNEKIYFNNSNCFFEFDDSNGNFPFTKTYKSFIASGWVQFSRFDQVIAGQYEVNAVSVDSSTADTLHIAEGRFDIKR